MNLSPSSAATSPTATEGDLKNYLANLRDYMATLLGADTSNKADILSLLNIPLNGKMDKSAAYTVLAADRGKVIHCTGSGGWDLTITAAATLGDGFVFGVVNRTTGAITINPNLSEQVAGQTTYSMQPGESLMVYCTGAAFELFGNAPKRTDVQTFTSSGTWIKPPAAPSTATVIIETWGAGDSGARGATLVGGNGGNGGQYVMDIYPLSFMSSTESVTIGAGGASRTTTGPSNKGGDTKVGAKAIAIGGGGSTGGVGADTVTNPEITVTSGASSIKHGGGGGGAGYSASKPNAVGGTSVYGGNGGDGSYDSTAAAAGSYPGGGGGGSELGNSGAGANGKAVITVIW